MDESQRQTNTDEVLAELESFTASVQRPMVAKLTGSWCLLDRGTAKRRIVSVIALSAELDKICQVDTFATAWGETAIESLIMGDLDDARQFADMMLFRGESDELQLRFAPIWKKFREILLAATLPGG